MKCLETERLVSYAYHLVDESAAAEVRTHLNECSRCRDIVVQHERLDGVLHEWKAAGPTPGFDARVRLAIEAQSVPRFGWGFWSGPWALGLAVAAFGILLVLGAFWFTERHRAVLVSSPVATRQLPPPESSQTAPQTASLHPARSAANSHVRPAQTLPAAESAVASSNGDKDAQALEDYDLAANFDVLSELPKGEPQRVTN